MGIITTYVCDVSGKQGPAVEFVRINIRADKVAGTSTFNTNSMTEKVIHKDVALKLNLITEHKSTEIIPEVTLESRLMVLLKEYIDEVAYAAADDAVANSRH